MLATLRARFPTTQSPHNRANLSQQRAPRWWLISRSEDRTCCKIVVIWQVSAQPLGPARQFPQHQHGLVWLLQPDVGAAGK